MAVSVTRFGPGLFTVGTAPGTDYSCQVQSMGVIPNKNEGDTIQTLCGDSVPGSIVYDFVLEGTVLQDLAVAAGLVKFTWTNQGMPVAFEFTPSTSAITKVAGTVVIDPLAIGTADGAVGDVLTSDFSWSCVGKPTVTWHTLLADDETADDDAVV
jgi:hypothetical protein